MNKLGLLGLIVALSVLISSPVTAIGPGRSKMRDIPAIASFSEVGDIRSDGGSYAHGTDGLWVVENDWCYGGFEMITTGSIRYVTITFGEADWVDQYGQTIEPLLESGNYDLLLRIFAHKYVQTRKGPQFVGVSMESMELDEVYECRMWSVLYASETRSRVGGLSHYETSWYHSKGDLSMTRTSLYTWRIDSHACFEYLIGQYVWLDFTVEISRK